MATQNLRNLIVERSRWMWLPLGVAALLALAPAVSMACGPEPHSAYRSPGPSDRLTADPATNPAEVLFSATFRVCGAPSAIDPYVEHGHPTTRGTMTFSIDSDYDLTFEIDLGTTRQYRADHAHFYNPDNSFPPSAWGESTICWAGIRGATALKGANWPGVSEDSLDRFYRRYLKELVSDNGVGWWLNVHMEGGHFATDEAGHLIEWAGEFPSFGGANTVKPECNAHQKRKLDNKRLVFDNACNNSSATRRDARDYFLDQMGVAWLDADGNLTDDAIAHGYDLDTDYLFYQFGDEGRSRQYGGPDAGIGGRVDGSEDARCDDWPVAGWAEPHSHVPEPAAALLSLAALLTVSWLSRRRARGLGR